MDGMDIMTGRFNPYNQGYFHLFFVDPLELSPTHSNSHQAFTVHSSCGGG